MLTRTLWRLASLVVALVVAAPLGPLTLVTAQVPPFQHPAFEELWRRTDQPVELKQTNRSWTWGPGAPRPNAPRSGFEPYVQGKWDRPGVRLVQYFDKARMEINDPNPVLQKENAFFVTNGRLVSELTSGRIALGAGAEEVEAREPATEPIAGDVAKVNEDAPTYASFREVATTTSDSRIGDRVDELIDKRGRVRSLPTEQRSLRDSAIIAYWDPNTKHNIVDKFWEFMNQKGTVLDSTGKNVEGAVFQPWVSVFGLPITEPFWVKTKVAGAERYILTQLFERRVLTYNPANPVAFQVEMGNVGQHYYRWRFGITDDDENDTSVPRITDGPQRTRLTSTTARLEWSTNKSATSEIWFGTNPDSWSRRGDRDTYRTSHSFNLDSLTPNTLYYWRVASRDRDGRTVVDSEHTFRTPATDGGPETPGAPTFTSGPQRTRLTSTSARIEWETNKLTTNSILFGTDPEALRRRGTGDRATSHVYEVTDLIPNTLYYWRVNGTDADGAQLDDIQHSFRTPSDSDDGDAPRFIEAPRRTRLTSTSARVEWETSRRTTGEILFGTNPDSLRRRGSTELSTTHLLDLTGLNPDTLYYWKVVSADSNGRVVTDSQHTFRTPASDDGGNGDNENPRFTYGPQRTRLTSTAARIEWDTNKRTTGEILFGTNPDSLRRRGSTELATSHSIDLNDLTPDTLYYWKVVSEDSDGRLVTDSQHTFRTPTS